MTSFYNFMPQTFADEVCAKKEEKWFKKLRRERREKYLNFECKPYNDKINLKKLKEEYESWQDRF